jgi:hypothetical protein
VADFVFNIAKGRVAELYNRVDSNDPANSVLRDDRDRRRRDTDATIKDSTRSPRSPAHGVTERSTTAGRARR